MPYLRDINLSPIDSDDPQKQLEGVVRQLNEWGRLISNEERTKITKDDAGDQRLLVGFHQGGFSNGDVGVKLSQPGVDVGEATGDQLIFSSDNNLFKIVDTGTTTITPSGSFPDTVLKTVDHDLGYVPSVLAFFLRSDGDYQALPTYTINTDGTVQQALIWKASTTDLLFQFSSYTGTSFADIDIKYYLLRETAS